jgi:serine protease Do
MPLKNWKKLIITFVIANISFIQPKALAQDAIAITIAEQVTVKISEAGSNDQGGSGVIIGKKNGKYIIATSCHVIEKGGSYVIKTYVNKTYPINISNPLSFCHPQRTPKQVDLAILELEISDDYNYPIAKPATEELNRGKEVFAVGFPAKDGTTTQRVLEINSGEINRINPEPAIGGYGLVHSAQTFQGMSGGGIFNKQGQLIAISGEARPAQDLRRDAWRFYGILAKLYLNWQNSTFDYPPQSTVSSASTSDLNGQNIDYPRESTETSNSTPVMFQKLEALLQARNWKEADLETWELMKKLTNRENQESLRVEDYRNFPSQALQIMDQLWVRYSNGKFGFSVQKQIWFNLGGKLDGTSDTDTFLKLSESVGWKQRERWIIYDEYNFSINAPSGHLPTAVRSGVYQSRYSLLFSKL